MSKILNLGVSALSLALVSGVAVADAAVYGQFPVTVKGYSGSKTSSTGYTGQIARHLLHDTLKKLAYKGNGSPSTALKAEMMKYFKGSKEGHAIMAPASKGPFVIKQTKIEEVSKGKNLVGKTYKGTVTGMPNGMTGG